MSGATSRDLTIGLMSACVYGPAWASDLREPAEQPASVFSSAPRFSVWRLTRDRDAG